MTSEVKFGLSGQIDNFKNSHLGNYNRYSEKGFSIKFFFSNMLFLTVMNCDLQGQIWPQPWFPRLDLTIKAKMETANKPIFQNTYLSITFKNQDSRLRYVSIQGSAPMVDLSALFVLNLHLTNTRFQADTNINAPVQSFTQCNYSKSHES